MGCANDNIASVMRQIIDAIRNGFAFGVIWKIGCENLERLLSPCPPRIFERTNQLFFLRIHADYRQSGALELATLAGDVAELLIALRILMSTQPLAIDAQGITFEPEQAGHRRTSDFEFPTQPARQFANCLVRPFQPSDRIASSGVFE